MRYSSAATTPPSRSMRSSRPWTFCRVALATWAATSGDRAATPKAATTFDQRCVFGRCPTRSWPNYLSVVVGNSLRPACSPNQHRAGVLGMVKLSVPARAIDRLFAFTANLRRSRTDRTSLHDRNCRNVGSEAVDAPYAQSRCRQPRLTSTPCCLGATARPCARIVHTLAVFPFRQAIFEGGQAVRVIVACCRQSVTLPYVFSSFSHQRCLPSYGEIRVARVTVALAIKLDPWYCRPCW